MQQKNDRWLWAVLGVLGLVAIAGPILGGGMMGGVMGRGMMGWYAANPALGSPWLWGLGMGLGWLAMLAFWGALFALGVLLVRRASGPGQQERTDDGAPLDVLKRRYAAGELNREQYQEMRRVLEAT